MQIRFYAHGSKIIDSHFDTEVCSVSFERNSNPLINAENIDAAKRMAKVIASAMNHHNESQGGI